MGDILKNLRDDLINQKWHCSKCNLYFYRETERDKHEEGHVREI